MLPKNLKSIGTVKMEALNRFKKNAEKDVNIENVQWECDDLNLNICMTIVMMIMTNSQKQLCGGNHRDSTFLWIPCIPKLLQK